MHRPLDLITRIINRNWSVSKQRSLIWQNLGCFEYPRLWKSKPSCDGKKPAAAAPIDWGRSSIGARGRKGLAIAPADRLAMARPPTPQLDSAVTSRFANLHVLEHPLIQHKLSHMRDRRTSTMGFRQLLKEISLLMGYELTRELPITHERIDTPLASMQAPVILGKKVAVVPILRAGLGMADGLLELMPSARVGHIGMYRDHDSKRPVQYLAKLPEPEGRLFILVDPMLATANSAIAAVDLLNRHGVDDDNIRMMALVAAPEGAENFFSRHPKVPVYVAALDERLDANAYIVPGLGDAGDRLFGTK